MDPASLPPLDAGGQLRKRWRYVGVFGRELMLCAARAEVGPLGQSFWVMWDREDRRHEARTTLRPGSREVTMDGPRLEIDCPDLRASLRLGEIAPIEVDLPQRLRLGLDPQARRHADRGHGRGSRQALGDLGRGVDDESAGYHQRHTSWRWSAGVGRAVDGRAAGLEPGRGHQRPAADSERAIWIDGEPSEPPPVRFHGMDGIDLAGEDRLDFATESHHARDENFLLLSSRYRHRFGTFSGSLGGLELAEGLGVMEEHDAVW